MVRRALTELRIARTLDILNEMPYAKALQAVKEEFKISKRSATSYIAEARKIILAETKKGRELHVADSYKLYQSIINSESARDIDRIRAQEQIDKLLGLQAPFRVAPTTPDGDQPWQQEKPDDLRSKLLDRLAPSRQ